MNAPELEEGDDFYLASFWELDTCRQIGMGLGPIPWRDMVAYAGFHGLEDDVAAGFVQIIRQMDAAYLEWHAEEERLRAIERKAADTGEG